MFLSKKKIGALAIGTIMTFGAAFPALSEAAKADGAPPTPPAPSWGPHNEFWRHWRPNTKNELNISRADVDKYVQQGYTPRDVFRAALIAKAGGQSVDKVLSYKTADTTWHYVMSKAGVTEQQLQKTREEIFADAVAQQTDIDKSKVESLIDQGYRGRDIVAAAQLAKASNKSVDDVLGMKKINNDWRDVAESLGVNWDSIRQGCEGPVDRR